MKNKQLLLSGHARGLIIFLFLASCVSCKDHSGINRVWAVDESEPLATDQANAVWANNRINIFRAKNEITGFQIIIEAGKTGVSAVNLKINDVKNGTFVIPGSDKGPADKWVIEAWPYADFLFEVPKLAFSISIKLSLCL